MSSLGAGDGGMGGWCCVVVVVCWMCEVVGVLVGECLEVELLLSRRYQHAASIVDEHAQAAERFDAFYQCEHLPLARVTLVGGQLTGECVGGHLDEHFSVVEEGEHRL